MCTPRIPEAGRFELRLADGAVNPYLLQAAILGKHLLANLLFAFLYILSM